MKPSRHPLRFLCAALLALPGAAPLEAALKNPDTVIYAHTGEILTLDPVYPYDSATQGMMMNVYDTLLRFDGPSLTAFQPVLASKVPSARNGLVSADGLTYRFPLRKDVRFHNGDRLTPEDVRYSLLRFMLIDPEGGPAALLLEPVFGRNNTRSPDNKLTVTKAGFEKAVKADRDGVTVRLKKPFGPFLSIMARWSYVTDKKWCVARGEWDGAYETIGRFNNRQKESSGLYRAMNGTGPFQLESWDQNGKQLILKAFPGYRGSPARIKRVILRTVSDFSARKKLLEAGDADIIDLTRPEQPQLAGVQGAHVADDLPRLLTDPVFFFTLDIDQTDNQDIGSGRLDGQGIPLNFFASASVRKAFAYSFDYAGFLKNGMKGKAVRARGAIPPGMTGYSPAAPAYEYNRLRAEGYFRKAFNGDVWNKGFRFTLTYNNGSDIRRLACESLKRTVEAMNPRFHIDLRGVDWPVYLNKTQNRKAPLFTRGWTGDYPDPHNFAFTFYHSKGRFARAQGYADREMDKLIETAVLEPSPAKRAQLYARVQAKAYQNAPQLYTAHPRGLYGLRDWLKGFYDNAVFMGIYFYPLSKQ
ncbi:MAG: peptide ABC transporter substrate-binding protein [Elusimicrobia bacterium CG08_land_8_20_14_0_20_59_10]|nr:MAG: peptide ABC transporter substrate-binding protein [Elusimicrobia bacterium CG08_land_8_20_14_0_20_59_10]